MTHANETVNAAQGKGRSSSSKKKIVAVIVILLTSLLAIGVFALRGKRYQLKLTEQQIQEKLDAKFPIERGTRSLLILTLSEPDVALAEGADRIAFGLKASVDIKVGGKNLSLRGTGRVNAGLRYEPDDHSFYLIEPLIESLNIQGVPVLFVNKVNGTAAKLLNERIDNHPIYTLRRDDLKQSAARLVLEDVTVEDGRLVITLGL